MEFGHNPAPFTFGDISHHSQWDDGGNESFSHSFTIAFVHTRGRTDDVSHFPPLQPIFPGFFPCTIKSPISPERTAGSIAITATPCGGQLKSSYGCCEAVHPWNYPKCIPHQFWWVWRVLGLEWWKEDLLSSPSFYSIDNFLSIQHLLF